MPITPTTQNPYPYLPDWAPNPTKPFNVTIGGDYSDDPLDDISHLPNIEGTFTIPNSLSYPMADLQLEWDLATSTNGDYSDFEHYNPSSSLSTSWPMTSTIDRKIDQLYEQYFSKLLPEQYLALQTQFLNPSISPDAFQFSGTIATPAFEFDFTQWLESQNISNTLSQHKISDFTNLDYLPQPINAEAIFNPPHLFNSQSEPSPFANLPYVSDQIEPLTADEKINHQVKQLYDQYFSGIPHEQYKQLKEQYVGQSTSQNHFQISKDGSSLINPISTHDSKFFNIYDTFFPNNLLHLSSAQTKSGFRLQRLCEIQDIARNESYMKNQTQQKQDFLKQIAGLYHREDQFWGKLLNQISPGFQPQDVNERFLKAPALNPNPQLKELTSEEIFKIMYVPKPKTYPDLGFFEHKYKILKNVASLNFKEASKLAIIYPWENFLESNINLNRAVHDFPYLVKAIAGGTNPEGLILGPTDGMNAKLSYYTGCLGVLSYFGLQGAVLNSFRKGLTASFKNYFEQGFESSPGSNAIQTLAYGGITERKSALTELFGQVRRTETILRPFNTTPDALSTIESLSVNNPSEKDALEILNLAHEQHLAMAEAIEAGISPKIVKNGAAQAIFDTIATNRPDIILKGYTTELANRKYCALYVKDPVIAEQVIRANRPIQTHHILSDKCIKRGYTVEYKKFLDEIGLSFNDPLNLWDMPHNGSHPKVYHEWIIDEIKEIKKLGGDDPILKRKLFEERIKETIIQNPRMLDAEWWGN